MLETKGKPQGKPQGKPRGRLGGRKPSPDGPRVAWSAKLRPETRERLAWWVDQHRDADEAIRALLDLADTATVADVT